MHKPFGKYRRWAQQRGIPLAETTLQTAAMVQRSARGVLREYTRQQIWAPLPPTAYVLEFQIDAIASARAALDRRDDHAEPVTSGGVKQAFPWKPILLQSR